MRRIVVLFAAGAVVLSFFDGFHTHGGATTYPAPVFLKMAWWTPLLFGTTAAAGGALYARGWRALRAPRALPRRPTLAIGFTIFAALYWASGYAPLTNAGKLGLLLAGAAAIWGLVDRTWQGVVLAAIGVVAGSATEILLTSLGSFQHLSADALGIPLWLPGLYLAAGPAVGQTARWILEAEPSTRSPAAGGSSGART